MKFIDWQIAKHFPAEPTAEMKEFAENVCLKNSKYIFFKRVAGIYHCYCTHCKKTFIAPKMKHHEMTECYQCNTEAQAKAAGRGRSKLVDKAYFVYFDKSLVDPQTVVAIGYYVERDYTGDYRKTETVYKPLALYIFAPGRAEMYYRELYNQEWKKRKTISGLHKTTMQYVEHFTDRESISKAIKGTQFETDNWEAVSRWYLFEAFDLYCKNYAFETLLKLGFMKIIDLKLNKMNTKPINWRGKNLNKILGVGKQDWKDIRKIAYSYTPEELKVLHHFRQRKYKCTALESTRICRDYSLDWQLQDLIHIEQFTSIQKILNYVKKQQKENNGGNGSLGGTLRIYRDYINECIEFEMDLTDSMVLFPKDLYAAHQRNIERKKAIADAKLNIQIRKRYQELTSMEFEYGGLFIRPVKSAQELTYEGNKLNHCVARYAKGYANGETDLFVIRRKKKPNKPFYTVEMKADIGYLQQVRGYKNCDPTEEVKKFIEIFQRNNKQMQEDTLQVAYA